MGDREGNWGRWGEDDERGALNLLDEETVLAAVRSCTTGRVYQLGTEIVAENMPEIPHRAPPQRFTIVNHTDRGFFAGMGVPDEVGFNEDVVALPTHATTHVDALCHVDDGGTFYNGHSNQSVVSHGGAQRCGIEKAGGFATRGLLVDVAAYKQVDQLEVAPISLEDFRATLAQQGVEPRAGDVVLVRTGWLECAMAADQPMTLEQPGIGLDIARWLGERDVVAVGADNSSVEATPWDRDVFLGAHRELLVKRGVYMFEHLWLPELSRDGCYEFLFSVGPLLVPGATGSPVNPIAIG